MLENIRLWLQRRRLERALPNPRAAKPNQTRLVSRRRRYWRTALRLMLENLLTFSALAGLALWLHTPHRDTGPMPCASGAHCLRVTP